jgi:hypothetical protein
MARDGKLTLRFSQTAFNAANQFAVVNYGNSATATSGAVIHSSATAPTASLWYRGTTNTLNRAGFRDTNADQSILVSGETSAILNDPAVIGGTSITERYVRITYAPIGPLNTTNVLFEIEVEAASDTGLGTAGTDWTNIGGSVPVQPITSYATVVSTAAGVVAGVVTTATAHGLTAGTVLVARAAGTGYAVGEPLFVVPLTTTTFGLTKIAGSGVVNTALSTGASAQTFDRSGIPGASLVGAPRIITVPINASTKPWIRVAFRATPNSGTTVAQYAGVWIDNVFMTSARDSSATF